MSGDGRPTRVCPICGREFAWRRKWERVWGQVKFCSKSCRNSRLTTTDKALEQAIVDLLLSRRHGTTICPSEAARLVRPDDWRSLMERTRRAARRLVAQRRIDITQRGRVVDPSTARGAIRLRATRQLRADVAQRRPFRRLPDPCDQTK